MQTISLKVNAKLNLALEVVDKYCDGFHNIDTLLTSVSVFDTITITKSNSPHSTVKIVNAPHIQDNIAHKTADLFVTAFGTNGADIFISKNIPVAGGMGGSSADAAGVIAGMCSLYDIPLQKAAPLTQSLGSDTKFMLQGGFARGRGRGDDLQFFDTPKLYFAVAVAPVGLQTIDVYREYDITTDSSSVNITSLIKKLKQGEVPPQTAFANNLQTAALRLSDDVSNFYHLVNCITPITMTGSGSCFFAVFGSKTKAQEICKRFTKSDVTAFVCETCAAGIEFL